MTGDNISQVSAALMIKQKYINIVKETILIEFSPSIDLHQSPTLHGSLECTLNQKLLEQPNKPNKPALAIALNISPNTGASTTQGNQWIYCLIIRGSSNDKNTCLIINSLKSIEYNKSITMALGIINKILKPNPENIKFVNTGSQLDDYNCGVWTLIMLERTLDSLHAHGSKFFNFSIEEILNELLLPSYIDNDKYLQEKRNEYEKTYKKLISEERKSSYTP